jgi:acetoacetyl-CoA synthetase
VGGTERGMRLPGVREDPTASAGALPAPRGCEMPSSGFYAVVEDVEGVLDSLLVQLQVPRPGPGAGERMLFVVVDEDRSLDDGLGASIACAIREGLSPSLVPDEIHTIPAVPRTITGERMEVPVRRLLEGEPLERVATPDVVANPDSLVTFLALAEG